MRAFFIMAGAALGLLIIAAGWLTALSLPADAASCGARDAVIARLADGYGEGRHGAGLAANGALMELFANAETGSWTIVVTMPNGQTCLVASGQSWEGETPVPVPQGQEG